MAHVKIHHEAASDRPGDWPGYRLCFQWCTFYFDDHDPQRGYRFIWRRANGHLAATRGQARIPSAAEMYELIEKARRDGWLETCESLPT